MCLAACAVDARTQTENPSEAQPEAVGSAASAIVAACDPKLDTCCPTGTTETVLTNNTDVFSTATANTCIRALDGSDVIFAGPRAYVIGGPGNDTINAYDHGTVVPGPGADVVSVSSGGTVIINDPCEVDATENLDGGGDGTLITPLTVAQLQARGATVKNFATVTIRQSSCNSTCVPADQRTCSGHGTCTEGAAAGQTSCACNVDFAGPTCAIFLDKDGDGIGDSADACPNGNADNGQPCDADQDVCTVNDTCQNNVCVPGPIQICPGDPRCVNVPVCTPHVGCGTSVIKTNADGSDVSCQFLPGQFGICERGLCAPPSVFHFDGATMSDPPDLEPVGGAGGVLQLVQHVVHDNAFARGNKIVGYQDPLLVDTFDFRQFTESVDSQGAFVWAFTNFDAHITVVGNDALGSRSSPFNGLFVTPDGTGVISAPGAMPWLARGFQFGYAPSLVTFIHQAVDATPRYLGASNDPTARVGVPSSAPSAEAWSLHPATILVPVQIIKLVPPPDSSIFSAMNGITVSQMNNLVDQIPPIDRSANSHPGGETFANVNYEITPGAGAVLAQFASADLIWAQCGIQFRAVSCPGSNDTPGLEACPELHPTERIDVSVSTSSTGECHITPEERVQIPAQCGCEDVILNRNSEDAKKLPGVDPTLPMILIHAEVAQDICQDCSGGTCGSVVDKGKFGEVDLGAFRENSDERFAFAHELGHLLGIIHHDDAEMNLMASFVGQTSSFIPQALCTIARKNAATFLKNKWGVIIDPTTPWIVEPPPPGL
jgi:hypothetical protein